MEVMVWHFVSNSHKVMTALIVMIPFKLGVWFWLRRHIFGKVLADLWYEMHTNVAHILCGQCRLPNPGIFECMKPQRTQVVASDVRWQVLVSFLFTILKFAWVNCPNFVQCVKPKHVSTKLEYTTIVDDYCAGGRVSDEYQGLCACASPSSSVCWRKEEFQSVTESCETKVFWLLVFLSHTNAMEYLYDLNFKNLLEFIWKFSSWSCWAKKHIAELHYSTSSCQDLHLLFTFKIWIFGSGYSMLQFMILIL